jgi:hypothetical protein
MKLISLKDHPQYKEECLRLFVDYEMEAQAEKKNKESRAHIEHMCGQHLMEAVEDEEHEIFLFQRGKAFVGFSEIYFEERILSEEVSQNVLKVASFYIVKADRRQRIGSHFLSLISIFGHEKGATLVEIEVADYLDAARHFLESLGYELVTTGVKDCWRSFI